jgi:hypothetical protein
MEAESHHADRTPTAILFTVLAAMALSTLVAPAKLSAQGTPEQRAACEDEARWLCSNYIPDADAIKGCMMRNINQLSPRCRSMFRQGPRRTGPARRHP